MSKPLRVRRLTDREGQQLQRIVRRGGGGSGNSVVRWRRALVVLASAGGNSVAVIARLVATSPDRVREMIHRFNEMGMASLDPQWAGGRPRRITTADEEFIVATATTRPEVLGLAFTRWSLRKLVGYLADNDERPVVVSRERLRQILAARDVTFQRTKTWKESNDPDRDAKLDRIEEVLEHHPQRCFAFDEFGPLSVRPVGGSAWAPAAHPQRRPANYHKLHGVRQFHGCYSIGDDVLWGVVRARKAAANTVAALKSIRAARSDTDWIYIILDNLSAHKAPHVRDWAARNNVEQTASGDALDSPSRNQECRVVAGHAPKRFSVCSAAALRRTDGSLAAPAPWPAVRRRGTNSATSISASQIRPPAGGRPRLRSPEQHGQHEWGATTAGAVRLRLRTALVAGLFRGETPSSNRPVGSPWRSPTRSFPHGQRVRT
ncbi:MAG: IS630 family transposase [bacterium]|nr:IS630 family transposase [bacterium]